MNKVRVKIKKSKFLKQHTNKNIESFQKGLFDTPQKGTSLRPSVDEWAGAAALSSSRDHGESLEKNSP